MQKVKIENDQEFSAFVFTTYIKSAMQNVEDYLKKQDKMTLPPKIRVPVKNYYIPEIDISE